MNIFSFIKKYFLILKEKAFGKKEPPVEADNKAVSPEELCEDIIQEKKKNAFNLRPSSPSIVGVRKDLLKGLLALGIIFFMWAFFFNSGNENNEVEVSKQFYEPAITGQARNISDMEDSYDKLAERNRLEQQRKALQEQENQKKPAAIAPVNIEPDDTPPIPSNAQANYQYSNQNPVMYSGSNYPNPGGYFPSEFMDTVAQGKTSEQDSSKKIPISFGFSATNTISVNGNNQSDSTNAANEPRPAPLPAAAQNKINFAGYTKVEPCSLQQGTIIPATLITGLVSDLPGQIVAQTRENVYDSITGKYLLIPQGARLIGTVDSGEVKTGQERIGVNWQRMILPNGYSVDLGQMPGADLSGYTGLKDKVSNHEGKILGATLMTSILSAAAQIAAGNTTSSTDQSAGQLAVSGAASSLMNAGGKLLEKNINIAPTIKIRPGTIFNVVVNQDIVLRQYTQ